MMTKWVFSEDWGSFISPWESEDWDETFEQEELDWEEPNSEEKEDIFF